jgi:hypothetical protein
LRVQNGNYKAEVKIQKIGKSLMARRKQKWDKAQDKEGLTYEAGSF